MKTKLKLGALIIALLCAIILFAPNQVLATQLLDNTEIIETVKEVEDLDELQKALANENVIQVKLKDTITIDGDVTINGNGKTITSASQSAFKVHGGIVEFKNLTIINSADYARCINVREGDLTLTLDNVKLITTSKSHNQPITIGAKFTQKASINLNNTTIDAGPDGWGYAIIVFNPVDLVIKNSDIKGYTSLYMKAETNPLNGEPTDATGTTGSSVTISDSKLTGKYDLNEDEPSNSFATIVMDDTGITIDIDNSELNAIGAIQQIIGEHENAILSDKSTKVSITGNSMLNTEQTIAGMTDSNAKVVIYSGVTSNVEIPNKFLPAGAEARLEKDVYVVYEPHDILVNKVENGTVTIDKTSALEGETITITTKANDGYKLRSLKAYTAAETEIEIVNGKFVMPNTGAIVVAEFEKIPYAIKIEETTNGKVTASLEKATEGETVKLTVAPNTGYELSKLTVNGKEVVGGEFTMPAGEVTVKAEFKKIPVVDFVVPEDKTENNNIGIVENETIKETLNSSLKADTELNKKVEEAKANGEDVVIEIKVGELAKDEVKEEEKQKILQTVAANQKVHQYFDISVLVRTQEAELGKIKQLTEKMKFSMEISKDLIQEGRKFYIIKLHGDEVKRIEATLNGTKLEFETDQFSTFALAYEDVETGSGVPGIPQPPTEEKDDTPLTNEKDETPKTGTTNIPVYVWITLAGMAVVGIVTTKKSSKHSR